MTSMAAGAFAYEEPGKVPSAILAVMVHLLLAVILIFGVHWQSSRPEAVVVELWNAPPAPPVQKIAPKPVPVPAAKPEPIPPPKPEPKVEPKPEPKVEKTVEPPKPDIALEKKKKEIKKPEPKKVEPKPKPKKPEPTLKIDRSKDIREQLARETTALNQQLEKDRILQQMKQEAAAFAAKADAAYVAKLKAKIKGNIVLPPDISGNPEAIFDVVQLPTGEVMSARLRKSSGHKAYDAAVERAILKSSPLPRPDRAEQFRRNLEIHFRPQD